MEILIIVLKNLLPPKAYLSYSELYQKVQRSIQNPFMQQNKRRNTWYNQSNLTVLNASVGKQKFVFVIHFPPKKTLPVYLGLMIHFKTGMKDVIEKSATLGLSITFNHVSEIQDQVMKKEVKKFDEMGLVYPQNFTPNIFTTTATDNINHNSTSSTA